MLNRKLIYVVLLAAIVAVGGCSDVPQEKLQSAQTALESAQAAGAETYATASWVLAKDTMTRAEQEVKAQSEKLGILRSFGDAGELFAQAQSQAEAAAAEAIAAKEEARLATAAVLESTATDLQLTTSLLATMPRGKDTRAEIESMQQELAGLAVWLEEAAALARAEDYLGARTMADQVNVKVTAIRSDLEGALAKAQIRR